MKHEIPEPVFLSVPDAAKICGVSRNTVYSWVRQGKLSAYQTPGKTNLIRPVDLVKFMDQNGMFIPQSLTDLAKKDDEMNKISRDEAVTGSTHTSTVMIVDDDPSQRRIASRAIQDNFNVYQAETGYQALHLLLVHEDINIVVIDLRMPGQHGRETIKEIRALRPDVGIIVISAYMADLPKDFCESYNVAKTIEKPFTLPALLEAVQDVHTGAAQTSAAV